MRLFGAQEKNLDILEDAFPGALVVRGDEVILKGNAEEIERLTHVIGQLIEIARSGKAVTEQDVNVVVDHRNGGNGRPSIQEVDGDIVVNTRAGRPVKPRTAGQKLYVDAIRQHDVVFGIGPAGTGKTYLAVASAVSALKAKLIDRIFLVRPVVEAGESLGFLPGDFQAKLDPYVRPIVDALVDMLGQEKTVRYMENGTIEVAPLAYMRGRTLNNAFVILDEAQNTTELQMKMFLTRIGQNAKAIVNGDVSQIDLEPPTRSGLLAAQRILSDIDGIGFVYMTTDDVVRHQLVQRIIKAFDRQ